MDMPAHARLGLDIKRTEQALMSAKTNALKSVELTVAQYATLMTLKDNPGISAAGLARACLVTPQAMTSVLRNLHERGLIERSAHPWHQNITQTRLTELGKATVTKGDSQAVRIERRIAEEFTAAERDTLRELLARCVSAIQQTDAPVE